MMYYFIRKYWVNLLITFLVIINYLIFYYFASFFLEKEIRIIAFVVVLVIILFPLREFLVSNIFIDFNWDYLLDSEFHHFEFLARFFTLENFIYKITPELMIWLKVNECRLFILNTDKKSFIMYLYYKGKIQNIQIIQKKRIFYLMKLLRKNYSIIHNETLPLEIEEKKILQKFSVYAIVPFYHLNRLMGFISFHNPIQNQYANRALEVFAAKAAFLIHDEILKKRIQNISKFEEEIKIAEKVKEMLQSQIPPYIPNFDIKLKKILTATLIEFFRDQKIVYCIIISIPKMNGIAGMILAGKLGYIFAYLNDHKENFKINDFLKKIKEQKEFEIENYPIEILILEIHPEKEYVTIYCDTPKHYLIKSKGKIIPLNYYLRLFLQPKETYSFFYLENELFNIVYRGSLYA